MVGTVRLRSSAWFSYQFDDAVFDALSLTQGERDAVYEGVTELVENRLRRARSGGGRG